MHNCQEGQQARPKGLPQNLAEIKRLKDELELSRAKEIELDQLMGRKYVREEHRQAHCLSVVLGFKSTEQGREALNRNGKSVKFEDESLAQVLLDTFLNETDQ